MPIEKKCTQCGQSFVVPPSNRLRKCCSRACSTQTRRGRIPYNKMPRLPRVCLQCEVEFWVRESDTQVHCSDACARKTQAEKRRKPLIPRVCGSCGRKFVPRSRGDPRHYCTSECAMVARTGKLREIFSGPRLYKKCSQCGGEFNVLDDRQGRAARFCSRACVAANQRGKPAHNRLPAITVECVQCGKRSETHPSHGRRGVGG